MQIRVNGIEFKYENGDEQPSSAEVSYIVVLKESKLEGRMTIENKDLRHNTIDKLDMTYFTTIVHGRIMDGK